MKVKSNPETGSDVIWMLLSYLTLSPARQEALAGPLPGRNATEEARSFNGLTMLLSAIEEHHVSWLDEFSPDRSKAAEEIFRLGRQMDFRQTREDLEGPEWSTLRTLSKRALEEAGLPPWPLGDVIDLSQLTDVHDSVPPVKMSSIYLLPDNSILIEGVDYEPTGPGGLASERRVLLSAADARERLGAVVLESLDATRIVDGARHDEAKILRSRLLLVGKTSRKEFETAVTHVGVSLEDSKITVTPSRYEKTHGGWFRYLPDQSSIVANDERALAEAIFLKLLRPGSLEGA